jgi:hypothetical protein
VKKSNGLYVSQTNDSITTISFNSKKFSYSKQEISELLSQGKIQLNSLRLKLLADLMSEVFPEYVFVEDNVMLVDKELNFDSKYHIFKERIKQKYLEKHRCKIHPSVLLNKDFKCHRYTTCLMLNNGEKPKECIATGDIAEKISLINNSDDVPKLELEQVEENLRPHYEQLVLKVALSVYAEKKNNNVEVNQSINNNSMEVKNNETRTIIIEKEDDETLQKIKNVSFEVYNQICSSIEKEIHVLEKEHRCPLIIIDNYAKQVGGIGRCRILSKFAKPIRVNARQPYIFVPKRNTCCFEQYRFPNYYFCWIYQEYYKKKDENEIEVETI